MSDSPLTQTSINPRLAVTTDRQPDLRVANAHGQGVDIRVVCEPVSSDVVRQSWTFSTDAGATWSEAYVLVMTWRS